MRLFIIATACLLLAACSTWKQKPAPYDPLPTPGVVEVPVPTYVKIDPALTKRCPWIRSAPLEEIPSVARGRKKCLDIYEANLKAIELVEGQPVPQP